MATSGSTDFSNNAKELVTDAHYLIGAHQVGATLSNTKLTLGLRVLNRMVKQWQAKGLHLWRYEEGSLSTVADTQSYTMGTGGDFTTARPLKITSMRHVEDSIDTPMFPLTRDEYFDQPNKAASGKPTSYYYTPRGGSNATGKLYIWPVDDAANTLKFTYLRQFEDLDSGTDDMDFPQEWEDCIVYNLGVKLGDYYGLPVTDTVQREAAVMLDELKGFSREDPGSVYVGVDMQFM